jgi:ABC-type Fe3+-hydroxamate transport system substrate-binding protein
VPSLTELLCAMNLGSRLVARTGYCVHPRSEVKAVPKVGGTKTVNLAKLRRLAPTHVLVNVDENRLETVEALRTFVPNVLVTHPCGPKDLDDMIRELARVFRGQPGVARAARRLRQEIAESLAATRPDGRPPRRVLYLVWRDPWMTVARDTWISRLLARVGWHSWPDIEGGPVGAARYPVVRGDEPWLADVDLVLLSSEPYPFDDSHRAEVQRLCPRARVLTVDGEAIGWWGPRMVAGLALLRRLADEVDAAMRPDG